MYNEVKITCIVIIGAILNGIAMNFFLIPAHVLSSGFMGVAQLVSTVIHEYTSISIGTGILLFLFNIPVAYIAWTRVGRRFTLYSILSVVVSMIVLTLLPIHALTDNIILNAVFGGVVSALGVGITLRYGASTGGMDIIAMVLSRMKDKPIGGYFLVLNGLIVIAAGFFFGWEKALFTLVTLYVSSRVIDSIHTRHAKVTAMIITDKGTELSKAIHNHMVRGITRIAAKGAFTEKDKDLLMIVITRYELYSLEQIIKTTDPHAFTNIVETAGIFGFFRPSD
ncbi:uncharacterized membrane-anchored protein YitT (DUF2179 family) [Pullulanibacillus pueri]|uniref:UPF0750 membrane protein YitT n=1 Tax=Pullulanibacillus pueri TaxID=1437324 RepID=A0A8J2ZZK8_9BACL|nr:YitT family protein [Pullulanibacillus pueri]MBM7680561.1 uncharacterized membrane-anchored protein YitT (DUF2179 family) [Pullulanibacillus pueri]GGH88433.1 UPF0750 membrane protein YitT [Pullulanibacillus pueri]